ncbi:MAG TPA: hypothetical protein VJ997_15515 [Longimicrobiales bacterium]|nr:hypothetical protein [Longimicrobiales bacterium]
MLELKRLSAEALDSARKKALHYRLLNQPFLAESICRDILAVKPDDQETLVTLCLAVCDQFGVEGGASARAALEIIRDLEGEYAQRYYSGIACERMAFARLGGGGHAAGHIAYDWFVQAMEHYEAAAAVRPPGNDDAILRWNTCARVMNARSDVHEGHHEPVQTMLE